ncbi:hypothetical protein EV178_006190 [Coemansia sp. RSA 1646]|nr:hypothetical protein EV178_006190 [Coemansia sp. RSA 1646]
MGTRRRVKRNAYSTSKGSGDKDVKSKEKPAPSNTEEKTPAKTSSGSNKRSLTFAIGGVLTLLGVAGYTFLRHPGNKGIDDVGIATTLQQPATQTPLESVAAKHQDARQKLDALKRRERKEEARRLGMLTEEEVDAILTAKENSWGLKGSQGIKLQVDTCQVSSNEPIEDYMVWKTLGTESSVDQQSAARYMFGVFDGHAGHVCAEQIAGRIGPMLDTSLEIIKQMPVAGSEEKTIIANSNGSRKLQSTIKQLRREAGLDWDHTSLALTATFINMDYELVDGALAQYRKLQDASKIDELLGPAVAGSCGLVAVVDTESNEVVVANTGDSRALLGVRLKNGTWKAVRLSEDQTGRNKNELARMQREHPGEEHAVISRGRVLGALMPTRAFGDSRYKWPLEAQQDLFPIMHSRGHKYATTPPNYITPPYVTAKPVIVRHQLNENDKFIVIASDGLYDQLSDAEVIDTVAQWYEANRKAVDSGGTSTLITPDKNAATHLIRTALSTDHQGRRNDTVIRTLLAIPPPHSRRFRDDISVTIVTLDRDNNKE